METVITRQLRMERGREQPALACRDDCSLVECGERFNILPHCVDAWSSDKDCWKWPRAQRRNGEIRFEAVKLASKGVAPGRDIHQVERRLSFRTPVGDPLREQDHPCACSPD